MKRLVLTLIVACIGFYSHAQKIKYKDLYVLLRAKNYKDGAGFLTKFLSENPSHPNANYQMALMLDFKINELDLLNEPQKIQDRADSAILFFDKAYALLNEKDLKKHSDDYYAAFKRRNLRSGKFEVVLSDLQLDIENRKNVLEKKKNDIVLLNTAFNETKIKYENARLNYQFLRETYLDELSLSLGIQDSDVDSLKKMVLDYELAQTNSKKYITLLKSLKKKSENIFSIKTIKNFSEQATKKPDYSNKKIEFANFSEWGNAQLKQIIARNKLMKNLILFDESLTILQNQILKDSLDISSEINKKSQEPLLNKIKKIDPNSPIYNLFRYKLGQLNLSSNLMAWHKNHTDTLDAEQPLNSVNKLKKEINAVEQLQKSLLNYTDTQLEIRYRAFIKARYQTKKLFIDFINAQAEAINNQKKIVNTLLSTQTNTDK